MAAVDGVEPAGVVPRSHHHFIYTSKKLNFSCDYIIIHKEVTYIVTLYHTTLLYIVFHYAMYGGYCCVDIP